MCVQWCGGFSVKNISQILARCRHVLHLSRLARVDRPSVELEKKSIVRPDARG